MPIKYSGIMNISGLNGKLIRMDPDNIKKLMKIKVQVTEKVHGEQFRIGIDEKGIFIGQRNQLFRKFENRPHWNKISNETKKELEIISNFCKTKSECIFFGELYGNGMQKGFTYPFNELKIIWFDIKLDGKYCKPDVVQKIIQNDFGFKHVFHIGDFTIEDALKIDIENMKSFIANEDYTEGIVLKPYNIPDFWKFPSRLIIKYKTKKFTEQKQGKYKRIKNESGEQFVSKFIDFITTERINHAIDRLKETGIKIIYEMPDLQYLTKSVIGDIEKEENDGHQLEKEDRKYLGRYIPIFYKNYLQNLVNEKIK